MSCWVPSNKRARRVAEEMGTALTQRNIVHRGWQVTRSLLEEEGGFAEAEELVHPAPLNPQP